MCFLDAVKGTGSENQPQESQTKERPSTMTSLQEDDAGEKTDKTSKQWGLTLQTFCKNTTFHGLRNVVESTSTRVQRWQHYYCLCSTSQLSWWFIMHPLHNISWCCPKSSNNTALYSSGTYISHKIWFVCSGHTIITFLAMWRMWQE